MKENSHTELKIQSLRALEFLATPVHTSAIILNNFSKRKWSWKFSIQQRTQNNFMNDKILTLYYFNFSGNLFEVLFLETLSRMLVNKEIFFLAKLSFRECENFLRDENHLQVFEDLAISTAENSFNVVKNSLLAGLIVEELKKNKDQLHNLFGWNHLTLVEKNNNSQMLIKLLNSLFSPVKLLQLVLATNESLVLDLNDFPVSIEVLHDVVCEAFGGEEFISSFKVVAV